MSVWIRGTVMLATLVGLPAAWIYLGPLPPAGQRLVDRTVCRVKQSLGWADDADRLWPTPCPLRAVGAAEPLPPSHADAPHRTVAPAVHEVAAAAPFSRSEVASGAPAETAVDAASGRLLGQLRTLGAADYQLETWGTVGDCYRFRCAMPLRGDGSHVQEFSAIGGDPAALIAQVAAEATHWHAARLTPADAP